MDIITYNEVRKLNKLTKKTDKMFEVSYTTNILTPDSSQAFSAPLIDGVNNVIIKSVYVEGATGSEIDVEILDDGTTGAFVVYKNIVAKNTSYDVVDLAYIDKSATNQMHFNIKNTGTADSSFKVVVLCISTN